MKHLLLVLFFLGSLNVALAEVVDGGASDDDTFVGEDGVTYHRLYQLTPGSEERLEDLERARREMIEQYTRPRGEMMIMNHTQYRAFTLEERFDRITDEQMNADIDEAIELDMDLRTFQQLRCLEELLDRYEGLRRFCTILDQRIIELEE